MSLVMTAICPVIRWSTLKMKWFKYETKLMKRRLELEILKEIQKLF